MIRRLIVVCVAFLFLPFLCYAQEIEYTKRSKNEVRDGPGNYYPLLFILPAGTPVKIINRQGGWIRFHGVDEAIAKELPKEALQSESWISKNCLVEKAPKKSWKELEFLQGSLEASPSSVAAAIRGYGLRYGKTTAAALDSLIIFQGNFFTPQEYLQFKKETENFQQTSAQKNLAGRFHKYFRDYEIDVAEEGIGLGIASRMAQRGLLNDPQLLKYVNLLGTLLSETTGAYDFPFKIFLLRDDVINAVSIPGGYIFITNAMLNLCRNEAELASIIAHEMMHIFLLHGVQEIQQRIMNIRMDLAMQELEKEVGEEYDPLSAELEDFAIEAYETVVKPRLQSYEEEADRGAALMLARAGYDLVAVPRMVLRMRDSVIRDESLETENPFAGLDFLKRYDQISNFINKSLSEFKGVTNVERFMRYTKK